MPLETRALSSVCISGGRGVLKNAPSPGPLSPKTYRILVGCLDCTDSYQCAFKYVKMAGTEARRHEYMVGVGVPADPSDITRLTAHWYQTVQNTVVETDCLRHIPSEGASIISSAP